MAHVSRGRAAGRTPVPFSFYISGRIDEDSTFYEQVLWASPEANVFGTMGDDNVEGPIAVGGHMVYLGEGENVGEYPIGQGESLRITVYTGTLLAADLMDNLFVAGASGIAVYPPGAIYPIRLITAGVSNPVALAVDPEGRLYLSNGTDVAEYARGGSTPIRTISDGIDSASAFAWDKKGNLLVLNAASVTIYAPKATSPLAAITSGVDAPSCLAIGPTGTVYVGNYGNHTVTEYDHERTTVSRTIENLQHGAMQLHVDDNDKLFELIHSGRPKVWNYLSKQTSPAGVLDLVTSWQTYGSAEGTAW